MKKTTTYSIAAAALIIAAFVFFINKTPQLPFAGSLSNFAAGDTVFESLGENDFITVFGSNGKVFLAEDGEEKQIVGLPGNIINTNFFSFNNAQHIFISHTVTSPTTWDCCDIYRLEGVVAHKLERNTYPPHINYDKRIQGEYGTIFGIRGHEEIGIIRGSQEIKVQNLPRFTSVEKAIDDIYGNWYVFLYDGTQSVAKRYYYYIDNGVAKRILDDANRVEFAKSKGKVYFAIFDAEGFHISVCDKTGCLAPSDNPIPKNTTSFSWLQKKDGTLYAEIASSGIYLIDSSGVRLVSDFKGFPERANDRIFLPVGTSGGLDIYELTNTGVVRFGHLDHTYARFSGSEATGEVYVKGLQDTDVLGRNSLYRLDGNAFKKIYVKGSHFNPSELFIDTKGNVIATQLEKTGEEPYLIKGDMVYPINHENIALSYPAFVSNGGGLYVKTNHGSYYKVNINSQYR